MATTDGHLPACFGRGRRSSSQNALHPTAAAACRVHTPPPCYPSGETLETCATRMWRRSRHVTSEHVLQGSFLTEKRERKHSSNTRAAFACTPCFSSTCNAMQVRQLRTSQESAQWYRTSPLIDQLYSTGTDPQCMGVPWHPGLIR